MIPTILQNPINPADPALAPLLADLQGNILKGHGRDHTINVFLEFGADRVATAAAIRAIGVTSAQRQLDETAIYKAGGQPGETAVFFFLTVSGYTKLGLAPPDDVAFRDRMRNRPQLADPAVATWDSQHRSECDAMLLVADDSETEVGNAAAVLVDQLQSAGCVVIGRDAGRALRTSPKGPGLEHFGYLDGRSQPLMLAADVALEAAGDGIDQWDPGFGPGQVALVSDPHGSGPDSFGSYFVYRKLEQNVRGFKRHEKALAAALGLVGADAERAGAMVVGRFENGTPLVLSNSDAPNRPNNNFNYALGLQPGDPPAPRGSDPDGFKCPFAAHIRKTNPRGDVVATFGVPASAERSHLMARRGIPYGERADDITSDDDDNRPTGGVGLLFMAYNQDIERQFEFTQVRWANDPDFVVPMTGIDPIIGQGPALPTQRWRPSYGPPPAPEIAFPFDGFVTMRGGEYFFAPSIGFLRSVGS